MNRILLALLALLTGLSAQVSPAHARIGSGSDTEIGSVETLRNSSRPTVVQSDGPAAPVARQERRSREANRVRSGGQRIRIPSVLLGIDRAYE